MSLKNNKSERIVFLIIILVVLFLSNLTMNLNVNQDAYINDHNNIKHGDLQDKKLKNQEISKGISYENGITKYSGIGNAWNVTHWANRTDYNLGINLNEPLYYDDSQKIDLDSGWEGYELNASIKNLYDERNWCNGTFNYGTMNSYDSGYDQDENDTLYITNSFQNWTFGKKDFSGYTNLMGGNYFDSSYAPASGETCLELRITGVNVSNYYYYDEGDECWWSSSIKIPRGRVIESILKFSINPSHIENFNNWDFKISINDIEVFSIHVFVIEQEGIGWHNFSIPISTSVFSSIVNDSMTTIKVSLEAYETRIYEPNFPDITYQQVLFNNIELITKAEVKPKQINLKMNSTNVKDKGWGEGRVNVTSNWKWNEDRPWVSANFSCDDVGELGGYSTDFETDLNLFVKKDSPETYSNKDLVSIGTSFSVSNDSLVNWTCYAHTLIPSEYEETEMRIEFPIDVNISWISFSQSDENLMDDPENCIDNSTRGRLIVPVSNITSDSTVTWKLKALSPNYYEVLNILNNKTGQWSLDNEFLSGEYINITAKITNNSIISDHIGLTKAYLNIRFPNGSIWTEKIQVKTPGVNGKLYFDPFRIPNIYDYDYMEGEYEAIITWNNSYSSYKSNETGIACRKFIVYHNSSLTAVQGVIYYEDILEGEIINLQVSFNDLLPLPRGKGISGAEVYVKNFTNGIQNFYDIGGGYYYLAFNTSGGDPGENNITIQANSPFYEQITLNITIDLILQTTITTNISQILQVPWKENFTIQLNYTEITSMEGIITTPTINWTGDYHINMIDPGVYNIILNSSSYGIIDRPLLEIDVNESGYEPQSFKITIQIAERETEFQLFIDSLDCTESRLYSVEVGENINITLIYTDNLTGDPITDATVNLTNFGRLDLISFNQYNITLSSVTNLSYGSNILTILAQRPNYETKTPKFTIEITGKDTQYDLFLNGFNKTIEKSIEVTFEQEAINITLIYKDINGTFVADADIKDIRGEGLVPQNLTEHDVYNQYNISINLENLTYGINRLTIFIYKDKYQQQTINFKIEIINIKTNLNIFLNNKLQTSETIIVIDKIPIRSSLNITLKYINNVSAAFIGGANIQLLGTGFTEDFEENTDLKQYWIIINTKDLDIGTKFLSVLAQKATYQSYSVDLRLTIERIETEIKTLEEISTINARPGQSVLLNITLNDLNFGGRIKGAKVYFKSNFERDDLREGVLLDSDKDGIYEVVLENLLENLAEGPYTITITVVADDDYEFESYDITLNIVRPLEEVLLFQLLSIAGIGGAVGLGGYLIAYQKVLKYPKPVRKVRKFRKTLKRKTLTRIEIASRESALKTLYGQQLGKLAKLLKGKTAEEKAEPEKIVDKILDKRTEEIQKKSPEVIPEKTQDRIEK